jgi:hypothetical protein
MNPPIEERMVRCPGSRGEVMSTIWELDGLHYGYCAKCLKKFPLYHGTDGRNVMSDHQITQAERETLERKEREDEARRNREAAKQVSVYMRSEPTLTEFVRYCQAHPNERFWQALRNWSEADFILYDNSAVTEPKDTFHWEGKNG